MYSLTIMVNIIIYMCDNKLFLNNEWSKNEGAGGLGYISFYEGEYKGPIAKNLDNERLKKLSLIENESVFFICDKLKDAQIFSGKVRNKIANDLQ